MTRSTPGPGGPGPDGAAGPVLRREPDRDSGSLSEPDRAELERLRSEVGQLRRRRAASARRIGWRAPVASLLIVAGCLLAPLSVVAVWTANQVSDTNRYVANVAPLISEPAVQHALTDKISNEITTQLDLQARVTAAAGTLSKRGLPRVGTVLNTFSGSIASAAAGFIHGQVAKIVASPAVARLWTQLNRTTHAQVVRALSGRGGGAISASNGQVTLSLGPFIGLAKSNLSARGLSIVNQLPAVNPTVSLFSTKYLVRAQTAYRALNTLKIVLPILTLVLLGLGVYVARRHRRALIGAGLGFAASMLVLGAALAVFRGVYLGSVPGSVLPADAAAVLFDTLVRFIKEGLRVLLVTGLIVAAGAFFTGPSVTAVRTRGAAGSALGWVRASGERAGLRTGPAGRWTYAHRRGLRVAAVTIAALIFVFWGQPTALVALVITILLLVVLGLIELIGRPPPRAQPAGQ